MRSTWGLLALLVLLPTASACTTSNPTPGTFHFLQWDGPDRVTFGFQDEYYSANVTTRTVVEADGPTPYRTVAEVAAFASAPDGSMRLAVRTTESGLISSCVGQPSPYHTPVGVDLLDAAGNVLRSWETVDEDGRFRGAVWANRTHGFVWKHPYVEPPSAAAVGELAIVSWSTGAVATHRIEVPAGLAWWHDPRTAPPLVDSDQLLLMGEKGAFVIDPHGPTTRTILSPFDRGWTHRDGDALVFGRWDNETGSGHADLSLARVRIADGAVVWQAKGHGGTYAVVPRGVALVDEQGGRLLRWRDGVVLPDIPLGADDGDFPPEDYRAVATLVTQDDFVALGIRGPDARLLVLGPDLEVILAADPYPQQASSTTTTSQGQSSDDMADAPLAPVVAMLAVAVAAVAIRRRL